MKEFLQARVICVGAGGRGGSIDLADKVAVDESWALIAMPDASWPSIHSISREGITIVRDVVTPGGVLRAQVSREVLTREEAEALGRRAITLGWSWPPGSLERRVWPEWNSRHPTRGEPPLPDVSWPDFRDAPTHGLLLKLVQECLGLSSWNAVVEDLGDLSPEALVVALENR